MMKFLALPFAVLLINCAPALAFSPDTDCMTWGDWQRTARDYDAVLLDSHPLGRGPALIEVWASKDRWATALLFVDERHDSACLLTSFVFPERGEKT